MEKILRVRDAQHNDDLTVLFLTVNKVPEAWAKFHMDALKAAIGNAKVITISKKPMDFGVNILQTEPENSSNIYWQMLKGARLATTPYIAIAEDDVLYHFEHFLYRPPEDALIYNMTRWSLFTFGEPTYSWRRRIGNFAMIAPRKLMIEALEERFAKYPNGTPLDKTGEIGKPRTDRRLGLTPRRVIEFCSTIPIIQFSHDFGIEPYQRSHKKRMSLIRAYEIPFWGQSKDLVKKFV